MPYQPMSFFHWDLWENRSQLVWFWLHQLRDSSPYGSPPYWASVIPCAPGTYWANTTGVFKPSFEQVQGKVLGDRSSVPPPKLLDECGSFYFLSKSCKVLRMKTVILGPLLASIPFLLHQRLLMIIYSESDQCIITSTSHTGVQITLLSLDYYKQPPTELLWSILSSKIAHIQLGPMTR